MGLLFALLLATQVVPFNHPQQLVNVQFSSVRRLHFLLSSTGFVSYV
jgi:hypothetical protein